MAQSATAFGGRLRCRASTPLGPLRVSVWRVRTAHSAPRVTGEQCAELCEAAGTSWLLLARVQCADSARDSDATTSEVHLSERQPTAGGAVATYRRVGGHYLLLHSLWSAAPLLTVTAHQTCPPHPYHRHAAVATFELTVPANLSRLRLAIDPSTTVTSLSQRVPSSIVYDQELITPSRCVTTRSAAGC